MKIEQNSDQPCKEIERRIKNKGIKDQVDNIFLINYVSQNPLTINDTIRYWCQGIIRNHYFIGWSLDLAPFNMLCVPTSTRNSENQEEISLQLFQ